MIVVMDLITETEDKAEQVLFLDAAILAKRQSRRPPSTETTGYVDLVVTLELDHAHCRRVLPVSVRGRVE